MKFISKYKTDQGSILAIQFLSHEILNKSMKLHAWEFLHFLYFYILGFSLLIPQNNIITFIDCKFTLQ